MINITKSQPAPACLSVEKAKNEGDYKCGEVLTRLRSDFFNKCYICEEKAPSTINVEHFKPHRGDKNLAFDWDNLFWACGHCNNVKLAKYDDILNCTDSSVTITDMLKFDMKPYPKENVLITPLIADNRIQQTAQLLNEVYNGTTLLKTIEGENIRDKVLDELISFSDSLRTYYYEPGLTAEDKEVLKNKIKRNLSRDAAFVAFKIWVIKANDRLREDFGDLIT